MTAPPPLAFLSAAQQSLRDVLTALPTLLVDKIFLGNTAGDEEIKLGRLKVITGSKYRQYYRDKYGPSFLDNITEKYLSEHHTRNDGHGYGGSTGRAVRFFRTLLGLGNGSDGETEPYREEEGVTTVALPPLAPVLFVFLVWKAGKHGARLIESLRDRLTPPIHDGVGSVAENGQASDNNRGLLDFLYDRMMGVVDTDHQPTSQNPKDDLTPLELPFLVALPISSPDNQESSPPRLRAINPDSDQNQSARNRRGPLAVALQFSTPDSVGLQSLIDPSRESTPSQRDSLVLPDGVSEILYTSITSAIMRGEMWNHDTHETVDRTPRQLDRTLGDHVGVVPPSVPPFDLLLRPASIHEPESLGMPTNESPGHDTILTEHILPSDERHNPVSAEDENVLVLLLDGDTIRHDHKEHLFETKKSTSAINVPVTGARDHKAIKPPNSPTQQYELFQSTSLGASELGNNRSKSEDRLASPVIARQDREIREKDAKASLNASRPKDYSVTHTAHPRTKPRRTSTTTITPHIPPTEARKHVPSMITGEAQKIDVAMSNKTRLDGSGRRVVNGSQPAHFRPERSFPRVPSLDPTKASQLRSRSRSMDVSGPDTAACSSAMLNGNVLNDEIGTRGRKSSWRSGTRNQIKTLIRISKQGHDCEAFEKPSTEARSHRIKGVDRRQNLPSESIVQEPHLRGEGSDHGNSVSASTIIAATLPPHRKEGKARSQQDSFPVAAAIPETRLRPPQPSPAVSKGHPLHLTTDDAPRRHNSRSESFIVVDASLILGAHRERRHPQSQSASVAVSESRPPLRKDDYRPQQNSMVPSMQVTGQRRLLKEKELDSSHSQGPDPSISQSHRRKSRPPRRLHAEPRPSRRPDSPYPLNGQRLPGAPSQQVQVTDQLRHDSSISRSLSFSSSSPPPLVARRAGQITV